MKMPTNMEHKFSDVPTVNIGRSSFDQKWTVKSTMDADKLYPVGKPYEVLPGDTLSWKSRLFARMSTPIFPIMDNIYMQSYFFFCPSRILWENFRKFMGERANPTSSISFTVPQIDSAAGGFVADSLYDYFGVPIDTTLMAGNTLTVNNFAGRGYNLIWNNFFKDQRLDDDLIVELDDGKDTLANYEVRKVRKAHDYFTSAAPTIQKGDAVSIGLTGNAPVIGLGVKTTNEGGNNFSFYETTSGLRLYDHYKVASSAGDDHMIVAEMSDSSSALPLIFADLSQVDGVSITDLRESIATQQFQELEMRYGSRYFEILESMFGVTNNMESYRPEFLGGSRADVIVTPVMNTSDTATYKQGELAGFGVANDMNCGFTKSFTEHGYVFQLVCFRADISYSQGLHRDWSRQTRYDFFFPVFQHLSEQAILKGEIYAIGTTQDAEVWGYQERYGEYRYGNPSCITGQFRSSHATPLDAWHLSEDFGSLPALASQYIASNTPMSRVQAVSEPDFIFDSLTTCTAVRPMAVYGIPGLTRL